MFALGRKGVVQSFVGCDVLCQTQQEAVQALYNSLADGATSQCYLDDLMLLK